MNYHRVTIEGKSIIWFETSNQYIVVEHKVADILENLINGRTHLELGKELSVELKIPVAESTQFILQIQQNILLEQTNKTPEPSFKLNNDNFINKYQYKKFYKISSRIIYIQYESLFELELIHPKFAYLECETQRSFDLQFKIFSRKNRTYLYKNNVFFDSWERKNIHYLQGKVSMLIVQEIYQNSEDDWIGVFHASALGNVEKSVLFLGDSGNGKSTSLALLQHQGYACIADDFVPVGIDKKVYSFPSAISVKKSSWDLLSNIYTTLVSEKEYHFSSHNKTVKYIVPTNQDYDTSFSCNELVFIKYEKNAITTFSPISQIESFEKLIPDSWISKKKENVATFFEWFVTTKSYVLTYSKNQEMFDFVEKLFNNEL